MRRQALFSYVLLLCLFVTGSVHSDGSISGWNRLVYLVYKLEVANYCSLTTERAMIGYHAQRKEFIAQYQLDRPLIESAQGEAWKLAYKEWDNRGLGGFRRWCHREGDFYLHYLENITIPEQIN